MSIQFVGLKEINGPLVVLDHVQDASFEEMVTLELEDGTTRDGRIVSLEGDKAVIQVFEGTTGLSLTNTYQAMAIDIKKRKPVFENLYAGLSGPAIKPISLRMVHQVAHTVSIPVMGIGGIATWQDAIEFIMAGASVVQIGAANFMDPRLCLDVIDGMEKFLEDNHIETISEIRGIV